MEQILGNLVVHEFKGMKRLESVSQGTQENINLYGLTPFVTAVMNEENLNKRFLAELFATYDPKKQVARIRGRVVNVNKDALAAALNLPPDHMPAGKSSDYAKFLYPFVVTFMFLGVYLSTKEMFQKMYDIKAHPELFDFAGFIWGFVENEILKGLNIQECYCGRHLQCLIRSQHPDLFVNLVVQEFKGMKRLQSVSQGTQENINLYGLSPFVTAVMNEENLNKRFLAELFATYNPKKQVAKISGRVLTVNKDALAAALNLPPDHMPVVDLGKSSDYANFLYPFVVTFMFLGVYLSTKEMFQKMYDIKAHPELFDFAGFIWGFVENEILKGLNIQECYCGRHLQCLIRSQHPDLFVNAKMDGDMDGTKMDDDDDDDDTDTTEEVYEFYDDVSDDDDDVVVVQEWDDIDDDDDDDSDDDDDDSDDDDDDSDDDDFDDDDDVFVHESDDDDADVVYDNDDFNDDDDDDDDDFNDDDDEKTKQPKESQVCLVNRPCGKKRLVDSPEKKQSSKRKQDEESKA